MGGTVRGGKGRGRVGGRWGGDREGVEGRTGTEGIKQRRSKEREGRVIGREGKEGHRVKDRQGSVGVYVVSKI